MPSELAHHWTLDPSVTFLNHGSFGATPLPVLEAQSAWRARMEREPVDFFTRDLEPALDEARAVLAAFVGADPDDLALVTNATTGINIVARSLRLEPGDEIVVTDHTYNAARNALEVVAVAAGARLVTAVIGFPAIDDPLEAILRTVTRRTRLLLLDHVTSPTALVLPARDIVAAMAERGIDTLVDGAHAPGMLPLDLESLGAAYYTANCHKWLCAPKGSGFLHVRRDRRDAVRPLVISHGANSLRADRDRFRLEHDWTGTFDPSAWLAVPAAMEFGDRLLPGGWPALMSRGHSLALHGRDRLCSVLGTLPPVPDDMLGSMAAVPLPEQGTDPRDLASDPLSRAFREAGIQVVITCWPQRPASGEPWYRVIRLSAAPYTDEGDLNRLAAMLAAHTGAR